MLKELIFAKNCFCLMNFRLTFSLFFLATACFFSLSAQEKKLGFGASKKDQVNLPGDFGQDTLNNSRSKQNNKIAEIELYKIINHKRDTTHVDTTLSIQKLYKFNYLRKDYFDLLPLGNTGQTYNSLSYDFNNSKLKPKFGAQAKQFNYRSIEETDYYHVPTPLTELLYKSVFEQGQVLDAFFTVNTSERLNFSLAYKGMRSLGKYQHALSSTGNFRFTASYLSNNAKYNMRTHVVMQDIFNQENGGISSADLENFENGNPDFIDRSVFDPFYENAESELKGKRFFLEQSYILVPKDSLSSTNLRLEHSMSFEDLYYDFKQASSHANFGSSFQTSNVSDKVTLEDFSTDVKVYFENNFLGTVNSRLSFTDYNYGYDALALVGGQLLANRLKGNILSIGGGYSKNIGNFYLDAEADYNIIGQFKGNLFKAQLAYNTDSDWRVDVGLLINSVAPNYNLQLYQSDYTNYNWQTEFDNQLTKQLKFAFKSKNYGQLQLDFTRLDNYKYFQNDSEGITKPYQFDGVVNYFRAKFTKELRYRKFAINTDFRFQKVIDGEQVLNVPSYILRSTLYYSNHFYDKALFLQTGINFRSFSKFYMNAYNPLIAEFHIQNEQEFGNFPLIDFFINAKIQQTRLYLIAEHFNSAMTGYDFYAAPGYPYRDFVVRFGLVWNFFQ